VKEQVLGAGENESRGNWNVKMKRREGAAGKN